jgi:hypothetical protein
LAALPICPSQDTEKESYNSLRLEGNATWHLTRKGEFGSRTCLAIIDTKGVPVDRAKLWADFAALEFLFGTPLRLDLLVGVAAFGASFGYRYRPRMNRVPPLPEDLNAAWLAVAFPLVATALAKANEAPNAMTVAVTGYVDSTMGHLEGQYLFAQVTLEAVAERLTPNKKPVVKDVPAWEAWVKAQRPFFAEVSARQPPSRRSPR